MLSGIFSARLSPDVHCLAVETIVNLMIDSQMQPLLNEFQYKSVSSLYKMLRQKMMVRLWNFKEHFMICKYELENSRCGDGFLVSRNVDCSLVYSHNITQ